MRLGSPFVSLVNKPEGESVDKRGGEEGGKGGRAAGFFVGSRWSCREGVRESYLWGCEEGRRGFREDSYKAIGTHIRYFQLHRVRPRVRGENVKQKLRRTRTEDKRRHYPINHLNTTKYHTLNSTSRLQGT